MKRAAYLLPILILIAIGMPLSRTGAALVLREAPEKASLKNPLFEALGSARAAIGSMIYLKADSYFHKGMDANYMNLIREAGENPDHPRYNVHTATSDWAMKINQRIKITSHEHLGQTEAKEVLPLLYTSTTLDPENLDAVLTTAYWLEKSTGDTAKSLEVLERAAATHPDDWKLHFAIAQILDTKQKKPAEALPHYAQAVHHLTPDNALPFDWVRTRYAWAEALAATGHIEEAIRLYEDALKLAEQREKSALPAVLRKKIEKLRATLPVPAQNS